MLRVHVRKFFISSLGLFLLIQIRHIFLFILAASNCKKKKQVVTKEGTEKIIGK